MNDGWATHRFSNGIRINNASSGGIPVIQLSNSINTPSFFSSSRLGIGTQDPAAALEVSGAAVFGGNIDPNSAIGNLGYLNGTGKMLIGFNRSGGRQVLFPIREEEELMVDLLFITIIIRVLKMNL
jgi:hypothetical protein